MTTKKPTKPPEPKPTPDQRHAAPQPTNYCTVCGWPVAKGDTCKVDGTVAA